MVGTVSVADVAAQLLKIAEAQRQAYTYISSTSHASSWVVYLLNDTWCGNLQVYPHLQLEKCSEVVREIALGDPRK